MGHSEYDPAAKERRPRTPATRPSDVRTRNRQQAARIGDLVTGGRILSRTIVIQQKTGRPVQFELLEPARGSNSGLARTPRRIAGSGRRERCAHMASVVAGALNRALKSPCLV